MVLGKVPAPALMVVTPLATILPAEAATALLLLVMFKFPAVSVPVIETAELLLATMVVESLVKLTVRVPAFKVPTDNAAVLPEDTPPAVLLVIEIVPELPNAAPPLVELETVMSRAVLTETAPTLLLSTKVRISLSLVRMTLPEPVFMLVVPVALIVVEPLWVTEPLLLAAVVSSVKPSKFMVPKTRSPVLVMEALAFAAVPPVPVTLSAPPEALKELAFVKLASRVPRMILVFPPTVKTVAPDWVMVPKAELWVSKVSVPLGVRVPTIKEPLLVMLILLLAETLTIPVKVLALVKITSLSAPGVKVLVPVTAKAPD